MFEASHAGSATSVRPSRPQPTGKPFGSDMPKVTFAQTVKAGKQCGMAVFPPKMPPTQIPVTPKPRDSWQMVQRKKVTRPGTKMTMVSGIIPVSHQIPCALLMSVNKEALMRHFLGILETVPGAEELLKNNPLKQANWSLNRDILHTTFASPLDDNLRAMAHHAFRKFFNVSDDREPMFIERPTVSSVKWSSVPSYDADNKEITEKQLADQILHQGLFAELKVTNSPLWIIPSNLKVLLNKSVFLNGKVCRTLPWINQASTPQCTQCLHWGHSCASCQTNFSYCTICSGRHMTSDHQNSCLRGESLKYELTCINCLAAGMTHLHKATDRTCPFYVECNNKRNITLLLTTIHDCHLEGFENPFSLTKVRRASQSSSSNRGSDYNPIVHMARQGNFPTQFLADAATIIPHNSEDSFRLASSNDLLFQQVPNITASRAVAASIDEIQDQSAAL